MRPDSGRLEVRHVSGALSSSPCLRDYFLRRKLAVAIRCVKLTQLVPPP